MNSSASRATDRPAVHWTVNTNYPLRTGSFAIMFASILFHGWSKGYGTVMWSLIGLHLLVYPHVMFWRARRSPHSQRAEGHNLVVDSLLFGMLMATLQFPLWIAFTVYIASTLNLTISQGTRGVLLAHLAFLGGALASIAIFGWHLSPETEWPTTLLCVLGSTVYMVSIGIAAFRRNRQLRNTREALRAGEQTLRQQLDEIKILQTKLQEQATRDPLTGLYNRRFLDTIVAHEIARCRRERQHLTVMMLDVDHFKKVNDSYGHPGGDAVLKGLAALLLDVLRATDVACRYGGEEFLLLLPGMPPDIALVRANQWRSAFADATVSLDGVDMKATLSVGIAVYPTHGETITELTHCADLALYRAKAQGRNRVVLYQADLANNPP